VTCPEDRLVAFLAGDLPADEERAFDRHLLGCEQCWQAVQADRAARAALRSLRQPAPSGLQDRVAMAVAAVPRAADASAAPGPRPGPLARRLRPLGSRRATPTAGPSSGGDRSHGGRRSGPGGGRRYPLPIQLTAAAVVVALAAAATGWLVAGGGGRRAPQVEAVVAMLTPGATPPAPLMAGEHLMISHQPVAVRAYEMHGEEAIVATSTQPFSLPSHSRLLAGASRQAWTATHGRLSIYGVNRPGGRQSMFLVANMPMAQLPVIAAELHLI
jgi:anti-sigma factor RsiW